MMDNIYKISLSVFCAFALGCSAESSSSLDTKQNTVVEPQHATKGNKTLDDYASLDLKTLEQYASHDDGLAQTALALNYVTGMNGVSQQIPKGMALLETAAKQGEAEALYQLSEMYVTPELSGVEDQEKSKDLLTQAAEKGHSTAQITLASRLEYGTHGYTQNIDDAIKWYERAIRNGNEEAKVRLESLKKFNG